MKHQPNRLQFRADAAKVNDEMFFNIAILQLVVSIEDTQYSESDAPVFKLYCSRLEQTGLKKCKNIHTGRLKDKLLAHIPHLRAYPIGVMF